MTKKSRTILFISLLVLFLLSAPIVILYPQGYRIDFDSKKITKTGALFLKTTPKQAEVYLNGKLAKKTDFLFGTALIENLLPKKYNVEVKKKSYFSWNKTLEIKEKEVNEVKNIVLIPEKLSFSTTSEPADSIFPPLPPKTEYVFGDFKFLIQDETLYQFNFELNSFEELFSRAKGLKTSPELGKLAYFSDSEIWIFFLKNKENQPQKRAGEKLFLLRLSEKIGDVFWLNSDYLIFNAGDRIKVAEVDERDRIQVWEIGSFPEPKIFFSPTGKKLYVLSQDTLYFSSSLLK